MVFVPNASSVMAISATLMRFVVSLFSAIVGVVFCRVTAVGAEFSLTSVTVRVKLVITGVAPSTLSCTLTVRL